MSVSDVPDYPPGTKRASDTAKSRGRQPHYEFRGLNKATDEKAQVGVAWINDDGSIRVKLNPFIVLTAGPDLILTLFTIEGRRNDKPLQRNDHSDDSAPF